MKNEQQTITVFGVNVGIEDPIEFQKLLDRYTQNRGVLVTQRDDGAIVMGKKDFADFVEARRSANLPTSRRLHEIEERLNQENSLFAAENSSTSCRNAWRRREEHAQNDFKLL